MREKTITAIIFVTLLIIGCWLDKNEEENLYNELLEEYEVIEGVPDEELIIYDKDTYIVYKAKYVSEYSTSDRYDIDAYFAENGKPFKYNKDTNEIEMITEE